MKTMSILKFCSQILAALALVCLLASSTACAQNTPALAGSPTLAAAATADRQDQEADLAKKCQKPGGFQLGHRYDAQRPPADRIGAGVLRLLSGSQKNK